MHEIVQQNIQDFVAHYGMEVSYELDKSGREGKAIIGGKEYLLIFRDQSRVKDLRELIPRLGHENILLICHKLYKSGQLYLEEEGVSYLEREGNLYFAAWQGAEEMKKRGKKNYYDQRINESRLKSKNGSVIREGFLIDPTLLNKSIEELAEGFNVGKSTVYYYISQMRKSGYIKETNEVLEIDEDIFDEAEILENMLVRGSHQLIPHWKFERYHSSRRVRLKGWGERLKGCKFYDKINPCENMCERIKMEVSKGYLVFISPYSRGSLKSLDKAFRKRFIEWFLRRQERIRAESG